MRRLLLFALVLLLPACQEDFSPRNYVSGLRILAVVPDRPEIPAGGTTTLKAWVVDAPGRADPITYEWALCTLPPVPGSGSGINARCVEEREGPHLVPLQPDSADPSRLVFTMPNVTPFDLGLPDASTGFYVPIRLIVRTPAQERIGVYRLRLFLLGAPNRNPGWDGMFIVAGGPDGGFPPDLGGLMLEPLQPNPPPGMERPVSLAAGLVLRAQLAPDAQEPYMRLKGDPRNMEFESVNEVVRVRWYADAGTFSEEVTGAELPDTRLTLTEQIDNPDRYPVNELPRPPLQPGDLVRLWAVATDDRGGANLLGEFRLRVE
jgi:hypothetical protein